MAVQGRVVVIPGNREPGFRVGSDCQGRAAGDFVVDVCQPPAPTVGRSYRVDGRRQGLRGGVCPNLRHAVRRAMFARVLVGVGELGEG